MRNLYLRMNGWQVVTPYNNLLLLLLNWNRPKSTMVACVVRSSTQDRTSEKTLQQLNSKWAWKTTCPKQGKQMKVFEGKTYHWCKQLKKWTLHKVSTRPLVLDGELLNPADNLPHHSIPGLPLYLTLIEVSHLWTWKCENYCRVGSSICSVGN